MTTNIQIKIKTHFLDNQSEPKENRFVFSYTIAITNNEQEAVQLLSRHWVIRDANNKLEEVIGEGVVGEQPILKPSETYEYTSGVILDTEIGTMEGFYEMLYSDEKTRKAKIPCFTLSVPRMLH